MAHVEGGRGVESIHLVTDGETPEILSGTTTALRLRVTVRGAVQGVGFRPFIYRLATELGLAGIVTNTTQGVVIEVEGAPELLETFLLKIEQEKPPHTSIQSLESTYLDPAGFTSFEIRPSKAQGPKRAQVLPDIATCPECLGELNDPKDRRYRYPFINCTHCGPRFSLISNLPYDRPNTTMARFTLCKACQAEYDDPKNRRFHAQPNACPECGPSLTLWDPKGKTLAERDTALRSSVQAIREGKIVAIKGLGGFHLVVDAANPQAVLRLRERKHREEKPFALMVPTLECIREYCDLSGLEERLLRSPEAPIVLLRRKDEVRQGAIAESVAPGNPYLGVMLPYTPLHHLLLAELGAPIVATSGNLSDEPICTDEQEALKRLNGIADLFLVHDRPIARHVDDSIVRVVMNRELVLRRARGFAPLPVILKAPVQEGMAVGGHLKSTVAAAFENQVVLSQHIGDLETAEAFEVFQRVFGDFQRFYEVDPQAVVCDAHPEYRSTQFAKRLGLPCVPVQHHEAHVRACMAENELDGAVLGVAWDGTGYGLDDTIWGGEFLLVEGASCRRVAHLRPFGLPGGEQAVKEPRRIALSILEALGGKKLAGYDALAPVNAFDVREREIVLRMLKQKLNTPITSSAGRLFDAVASLVGLRQVCRFEAQAAMELEYAAEGVRTDQSYPAAVVPCALAHAGSDSHLMIDWEPMILALLKDLRAGVPPSEISAKFHNGLAQTIAVVAGQVGAARVALTGGCFQNRILTERAVTHLRAAGLNPYWHQRVPPNDGGIALGQIAAAAYVSRKEPLVLVSGAD